MQLFLFSSVCHQILYHLPVHQRLPAEEIYFQITAVTRILDQKIQRLPAHFIGHQRTSPVIFPLFRKTVFTGQVAVMCDMKAERLYHRFPLLYLPNIRLIDVLRKKQPGFGKLDHRFQHFLQIRFAQGSTQSLLEAPVCFF